MKREICWYILKKYFDAEVKFQQLHPVHGIYMSIDVVIIEGITVIVQPSMPDNIWYKKGDEKTLHELAVKFQNFLSINSK